MDDKTLQKHYERIMRELENEKLLTFDELVNITKIRPEVLKRTIPVLARGLCYYQQQKEELLLEDEDIDEHWTVQDMQDIVAFEEKRDQAMQKYHKEKVKKQLKIIENKENIDFEDKELTNESDDDEKDVFSDFDDNLYINDNPNFEKNDGIVSFEDLVKLTGTHPFYLERCLCHLAILAETEN
ncbi:uncharacterized protein LOC110180545 isoform X1 [Drosophila serrata]|uniref:uncharacterized protein LOC110180545 isoform X1 n=1 Tax=Drosophila serrata TaxID=7274 RepID=UPI000A1D2BB8|nr:uncharacterized protein LOC110180545 isoform X1 [Drosophila serrata]